MEQKKFLQLNDIEAYKITFHLSNYVWDIVVSWDVFSKRTIGAQFINAVDSIRANIAEGFGRYYKKEKIQFYRYSYGSLKEYMYWNAKSRYRILINERQHAEIFNRLRLLPVRINTLIKFTNEKLEK